MYEISKVDCIYQHQSVLYRFVVVVVVVVLFLSCFTSTLNSHGHVWTVS